MVKVILFMASSANGIIARNDYSEDFLSEENWREFVKQANKAGAVIWGRKTYEEVSKWDNHAITEIKQIIVVSRKEFPARENAIFVNSPEETIKMAKKWKLRKLILSGGSKLNTSFITRNLIDEVILNINPILIGQGIKIFEENNFENKLELIKIKKISGGILQLHYKIKK